MNGPHRAGLPSDELWCLLSPPLECVTVEVLWCGLKLSTGCADSGASWEVQFTVAINCILPRATKHELQSGLHMTATVFP